MARVLEPVTIRGRYLWVGQTRFMVNGVVYQNRQKLQEDPNHDPICDDCLADLRRDIEIFKELGLNTLLIFSIDPGKKRAAAMQLLMDAGIYVLVGLRPPGLAKYKTTPFLSYDSALMDEYFAKVDCMAAYTNVLGLLVASEALGSDASGAPAIRSVTRDVKRYMSMAYEMLAQRRLPVGYMAAEQAQFLKKSFDFFSAGSSEETVDFFCFNNYIWAGESSMRISGYNHRLKLFAEVPIPVFFSEYGVRIDKPRIFQETTAIYSPAMTHVFSGGIVFEYMEGSNGYGLVKLEQEEDDGPWRLVRTEDFENLKSRLQGCTEEPNTLMQWAEDELTGSRKPDFPLRSSNWNATAALMASPVDWAEVRERLEIREWVDVKKELSVDAVDELADRLGASLDIAASMTPDA